jgi:hypothetical protein
MKVAQSKHAQLMLKGNVPKLVIVYGKFHTVPKRFYHGQRQGYWEA